MMANNIAMSQLGGSHGDTIVVYVVWSTIGLAEAAEKPFHLTLHTPSQRYDSMRYLGIPDFRQAADHLSNGFFPGDCLPISSTPLPYSLHRTLDAVRIVDYLQPVLPFGASLAPVAGMCRQTVDLDCSPVHHPDYDAATSRALSTDGG
jgi:hypothetical protein